MIALAYVQFVDIFYEDKTQTFHHIFRHVVMVYYD